MRIDRIWAMPDKNTFRIKPIKELLREEMMFAPYWIDPFCSNNSPALITNDINDEVNANYHLDALEFLKMFDNESVDGVLFDPPYSPRQLAECYKNIGISLTTRDTQARYWGDLKIEIARVIKDWGKCISFAWNSGGIGKKHGFNVTRILLVPHGGWHNDTIVTVERKVQNESLMR
jgi:hypothetical protein